MSKKTRFHCERLEDRQLLAADLASVELFEVRDLDDSPISSLATVFVDQNGDATLEIDLEDRKVPTINVFHVDDVEINGDGSAASPFNDIGTALTSLQGTVATATLLVEPGLYTWGSLNEIGYNFNIIGSGTGSDPSAATIVTHAPEADPDNTFAAQFRVSRAYMEGITFDGNFTSGSVVDIRNAAALTIVDSEFKNAGAGDGINIINTAEVVVIGSTAHNNYSDGFSYTTGANPEAYMEVLEADVHSYANGQNGEWNSQGSTVHKNVDIVRVRSLYEDNPTNISDVANGKSWQIDVTSRNALSNDQGNQFLNFNISGGGTAWIVGGDFSEGTNSPSAVNANPGSELRYVSLFRTLDPATHTVTGNVVLDDTPLVPVGSGEPTEVSYDIGNLGSGIVGPDTLNGIAYVMYSDQNVHARFVGSSLPGSNSDHLVVVRYDSEWLFFDNVVWTPFTPVEDDRILAEVAFQQTAVADQNDPEKLDVITDLKGSLSAIFGIPAGYSTGDLEFTPDRFGAGEGVFNNGELKASGTFFEVASNDAGEEPEIVEPNGAGFSLETIATGLLQPTSFAVAPDGRIFVAEKKGRIKIVENGQVVSTFLSITDEVASVGDRGLIGLTLDPDFENNGHVYYQYTVLDPDGDGITPDEDGDGRVEGVGGAVERVTVSAADPLVADMSTRVTVLDGHRMTGSTHSVGDIDFDNDGNLIFTWGDGGFGDIRLEAQDPNSVQGKLFRIDPVTLQGVSSNPFFDVENPDSVASKVWALGLRNSWKLTVDRATGDVYMGEVTDRGPEEINVVRADGSTELNFGWPYYEGDNVKDSYADQIPEGFTFELPFLNLPHLDLGFGDAITGGAVYRGDAYPEVYNGRYFFGSIVPGLFYTADQEGDFHQFGALGEYGGIGDIQLGPDGHIWTMSLFTGTISRMVFDPEAAAVIPPTISATQSQSAGESAVTVQFDATASTAIDGDLTFAWDFDSDGIVDSTDPTATHTFTTLGKTVTTLTVTDSVDASSTQLFETTVLESADATNLALGKATTQSETAFGGLSSRAVDGNVDGVFASESVALTTATQFTLWEVDLGEVYDITSIDIFERTDPSGTRLENFVVLISELPFSAANLEAVTADPGVVAFNFDDMDDLLTIVDETDGLLGRGQFVRIQLALDEHDLALAEVRVFGDSIVEDPTPTITQEDDTIFVQATDNDEVVELTLGETVHVLSINETEFTFDANVIKTFRIDAGLGFDKVMVNGTSAVERVRIIEADGTLTSSEFSVFTFAFDETHYVGNGGNDYAEIFGSSANDGLQALPEDATLTTPDNVIRAEDFPRIDSYGRGGYDYGSIYGTQVDDLYFMRDNYALMSGGGVINYTKGFERVDAFGRGGNDRAQLYDSESNDLFVALPTHAYVSNGSRISYTKGFERVDAFSVEGGNDRAVFYDDALTTETFTSRTNYAFMRNSSFLNYASNFAVVDAISTGGGDTASFYEVTTPTLLFARDDVFQLIGAGRDDSATGFASILAEADEEETPTTDVVDIDFVLDLVGTWI